MSKSEIIVTCFFRNDGDDICKIIFGSFYFFLQKELTQYSQKLVFPVSSHV